MSPIRPYPSELVGDEAYLDELVRHLEGGRFPDPDADLIPELTKSRFVAEAARAGNNGAFADQIDAHRETVLSPLIRFEVVATLIDDHRREQLDEAELDEFHSIVELPETISPEDDPKAFVSEALSERELTFFDYPAPPLHVIEAAAFEGRELIDDTAEERVESVLEQHQTYVRQRATIKAIVGSSRFCFRGLAFAPGFAG